LILFSIFEICSRYAAQSEQIWRLLSADYGGFDGGRFVNAHPRCIQTEAPHRYIRVGMKTLQVWFDGGCPLCLREIALMRRLDWRGVIEFIDVAPPDSVCPLEREALLARFHACEGGVMVSGAAAFAAMWRVIPLLKPLGWAARNLVILAVLEALYLRFLRIRPRLQRALRA
jgi:predicted DCC family thiol-disulfide oxidoreductase YuxK